jgi:hypothetical protein
VNGSIYPKSYFSGAITASNQYSPILSSSLYIVV